MNKDKQTDKNDNTIFESLKNFTQKNLFQKEVFFYIAKLTKEDEIKKLKDCFLDMDKNNTGTLDFNEIDIAFKKMGIVLEEVIS